MTRATVTIGSGNVFRDFGFSEEKSAELNLKSSLLQALQEMIKGRGWKQVGGQKGGRESFLDGSWAITTRDPFSLDLTCILLFTSGRPWAYPASHETVGSVSDYCAAWVSGIGLSRRIELFN